MQVSHDDALAATHVLHLTGRSTNFEHYPPHKVAHTLRSLTWCRDQAEQIGTGATKVIKEVSSASATHGLRAIQTTIGLRDKRQRPPLSRMHPSTRRRALPHHQRTPRRGNRTRRPTRRPIRGTTAACAAPPTRSTPHRAHEHAVIYICCTATLFDLKETAMTIHDPSLRTALKTLAICRSAVPQPVEWSCHR